MLLQLRGQMTALMVLLGPAFSPQPTASQETPTQQAKEEVNSCNRVKAVSLIWRSDHAGSVLLWLAEQSSISAPLVRLFDITTYGYENIEKRFILRCHLFHGVAK